MLVHGLIAHADAVGEYARADPIRVRKLQHRHARHAEVAETGRVELGDDSAVNGLGWHPQQGADQHLLRCDGQGG